jgi:hypothetical protein
MSALKRAINAFMKGAAPQHLSPAAARNASGIFQQTAPASLFFGANWHGCKKENAVSGTRKRGMLGAGLALVPRALSRYFSHLSSKRNVSRCLLQYFVDV